MHRKRALQIGAVAIVAVAAFAIYSGVSMPFFLYFDSADVSMARATTLRAAGLEMTLRLPRGPYFLGELLPVAVTLRNRSGAAISYFGWPTAGACGATFSIYASGGAAPLYVLPPMIMPSCPASLPHQLKPGGVLAANLLVPLTASGRVTVAAQAELATITRNQSGGQSISWTPSPIKPGWPSMTIAVAPRAPASRVIHLIHVGPINLRLFSLFNGGPRVLVAAPRGAVPHLLYQLQTACVSAGGTAYYSQSGYWQPLQSVEIDDPGCGGGISGAETWTLLVGAPGYAIASGSYR